MSEPTKEQLALVERLSIGNKLLSAAERSALRALLREREELREIIGAPEGYITISRIIHNRRLEQALRTEAAEAKLAEAQREIELAHAKLDEAQRQIENLRDAQRQDRELANSQGAKWGRKLRELEAQLQAAQEAAVSIAADKHAAEAQLQAEREKRKRMREKIGHQINNTREAQLTGTKVGMGWVRAMLEALLAEADKGGSDA